MNYADKWSEYLNRVSGEATDAAIATAVGVSGSTISRWRSGASHPKPLQCVDVARAYGVHPLTALVNAGYLTYDDVDVVAGSVAAPKNYALDDFETIELVDEIARRLREGV